MSRSIIFVLFAMTGALAEEHQSLAGFMQSVSLHRASEDGEARAEPKGHVLVSDASAGVAPDPQDPADLQSPSRIVQLGVRTSNYPPEIGQLNDIPPPVPNHDDSGGLFLYQIRRSSILLVSWLLIIMVVLYMIAPALYLHMARIILQTPRSELLANGCVLLYTVATITADIIIQTLHIRSGGKYNFHPSVMVFLVEFGKLGLNSILAMADYKQTRSCSPSDFFWTMRLMMIPAACFFTLNLIRFYALADGDLGEYRVFRSFDVVIVAGLWCVFFKRTLKVHEMVGVGLVTLSCVSLGLGSSILSGTVVRGPQTAIVLLMAFISSLGMVTNEMGFRSLPHLTLFTQNCALYVVSCTINLLYIFATIPLDEVLHGIDRLAVALLLVDVTLGLCVSCVLKYANAIIKQLATGWITPLEPLVGHWLVGTTLSPMSLGCTLIAGLGNVIYRMESTQEWGRGWKARLYGDDRGKEEARSKSER